MVHNRRLHFVNRKRELSFLKEAIEDWNSRKVVFIQGKGGVGKSALLRESYRQMLDYLSKLEISTEPRQNISRIGVLLGIPDSQWARSFLSGCNEAARQYEVTVMEADGQNDPEILAQEFQRLLSQKAQVIIIDIGFGEKLQTLVTKAVEQGIIVLSVASNLTGEDIIQVDQDEKGLASRCLDQLFDDINGQGEIAVCWNQFAPPLLKRREELENYLNQHPFIHLVAEIGKAAQPVSGVIELGSSPEITDEVEQVLSDYPNLKAIWATTADFSLTAVHALRKLGRSDVSVYGIDIDDRLRSEIVQRDSCLKAVVGSEPAQIGKIMVQLALLAASGEKVDRKQFVPINMIARSKAGDLAEVRSFSNQEMIIGKEDTFILKEFGDSVLIDRNLGRRWLVINFIDLDNIDLRSTRDIQLMMVKQIGEKYFQVFLEQLELLREQTDLPIEIMSSQLDDLFLQCLDRILPAFRLVIFCDTTDALDLAQGKLVTDFLIKIADHTHNIAVFLSGRTAKELYERTGTLHIVTKHLIDLKPLDTDARTEYLNARVRYYLASLHPSEQEKILTLTDGIPMLIDLAMDWKVQAPEMDWLSQLDLAELKNMQPEDLKQLYTAFEKSLVEPILRLQKPLDRLFLAMARVYPLDVELCATLLDIPEQEASRQIELAKRYSFVKQLPDGKIKLHDYMQEMVSNYVWPKLDQQAERKTHDSERALKYYLRRTEELSSQLAVTKSKQDFVNSEILERVLWQTNIQAMQHYFVVDHEKGNSFFNNLFTRATQEYRLDYRDRLFEIAQPYIEKSIDQIDTFDTYDIQSRHIRHLIDRGKYDRARRICHTLLESTLLAPNERMDILSKLADCELQSGRLKAAEEALDQALLISNQDVDLQKWNVRLLTTKGRVLSMQGKLADAKDIYDAVLAEADHDPSQHANILHNMGFLAALEGDYETAKSLSEQALSIRKEWNDRRGIGASMIALGEIYRNQNEYARAIEYYNEALRIFEPQAEPLWLARIYAYRGTVYRLQGKYAQAVEDIKKSISLDVPVYKPYANHLLGCVAWDQGNFDEAIAYFNKSDDNARGNNEIRTMVNNTLAKAEIYFSQWKSDKDGNTAKIADIELYKKRIDELCKDYPLPHHEGRMEFLMAQLHMERCEYQQALELFAQALIKLSTRIAGYGQTTFDKKLLIFENELYALARKDKDMALAWCTYLQKTWSARSNPSAKLKELSRKCNTYRLKINLL